MDVKSRFNRAKTFIVAKFEENPIETAVQTLSALAAIAAGTKAINDIAVSRRNSKTWAREVKRRENLDPKSKYASND